MAKNTAFWLVVALHYNRHKLEGEVDPPSRSLETNLGEIKVVIAKFIGCYWIIIGLDESGTT